MDRVKILFICHGNICRSPMAEAIMKHLVNSRNIADNFIIDSAATRCEELGNPVYPPARRILTYNGINCPDHAARRVTRRDYDEYDLLIVMDENNRRNLVKIIGEDDKDKIHLLMEYAGLSRGVADPWYSGDFEQTFDDVMLGCERLLEKLI